MRGPVPAGTGDRDHRHHRRARVQPRLGLREPGPGAREPARGLPGRSGRRGRSPLVSPAVRPECVVSRVLEVVAERHRRERVGVSALVADANGGPELLLLRRVQRLLRARECRVARASALRQAVAQVAGHLDGGHRRHPSRVPTRWTTETETAVFAQSASTRRARSGIRMTRRWRSYRRARRRSRRGRTAGNRLDISGRLAPGAVIGTNRGDWRVRFWTAPCRARFLCRGPYPQA